MPKNRKSNVLNTIESLSTMISPFSVVQSTIESVILTLHPIDITVTMYKKSPYWAQNFSGLSIFIEAISPHLLQKV